MQLNDTELAELIRFGGMAPSGGNAQPWQVLVRPDSLELALHPKRTGSLLDVGHLASVFSTGSFLENVCLAASAMGLTHRVKVHEFRGPSDTIATISFLERTEPTEKDPLYEQIPRRHTNRQLHHGPAIPQATIEALGNAIGPWPLVRLCAVSSATEKQTAAALLGKGQALIIQHHVLFGEMMRELRWTRQEAERTRDGVAISTLELPTAAVLLLRALRGCPPLRKLLPRGALEKMLDASVLGCSHLCVLASREPFSTDALVHAGRALQRLWLKATALQLAIQPIATLPFLLLRLHRFGGAGLSASEARELDALGAGLKALHSLGEEEFPVLIFRLSSPVAAASDRALRLPYQSLYSRE